ncbi:MAG: outer membrane beta-barrel protein [Bacteroidetes bacterium]|jgi:hypothetical protein|nr:outer membrane beta-barrel protein [Bacteroidota bacterium]
MKKNLLLFVLFLSINLYVKEASAQIMPEFGIRGGINFASLSDSKQEVDSRRVGLLSGVYGTFQIPFIPISIQPEVLYSQKGAEINGVEVNLSYIEIPVLARINLASKVLLTPHIYAGPSIGFKLNYKEEPPPADDEIQINNTDYGLVFGGGFDVRKINLGFRFSIGLNEIFDIEEERNSVIAIIAGIDF